MRRHNHEPPACSRTRAIGNDIEACAGTHRDSTVRHREAEGLQLTLHPAGSFDKLGRKRMACPKSGEPRKHLSQARLRDSVYEGRDLSNRRTLSSRPRLEDGRVLRQRAETETRDVGSDLPDLFG